MRWIITFTTASIGATIVALAGLWLFGVFDNLGLDTSGIIALSLGIIFTVALTVGLMALIFYSERREEE